MSSNDPDHAPLRDVAQNPDAFVRYLEDIQRVVLDISNNLAILHRETRVHCRSTHVEGDRWYHARLRARPVENALKDVLKHLNGITTGLERSRYNRRAHEDEVNALPGKRHQKALQKAQKKNPTVRPIAAAEHGGAHRDGEPNSIYDLGTERSA